MNILKSAVGDEYQHFVNLNERDGDDWTSLLGNVWEIDEATYEYFLGMMPPIYVMDYSAFLILEATTEDIHAAYFPLGSRYCCGYVRRSRAATAIAELSEAMRDALPAD